DADDDGVLIARRLGGLRLGQLDPEGRLVAERRGQEEEDQELEGDVDQRRQVDDRPGGAAAALEAAPGVAAEVQALASAAASGRWLRRPSSRRLTIPIASSSISRTRLLLRPCR